MAKKELEEGKKLFSERQKFIKLADRSECGWATVFGLAKCHISVAHGHLSV